MNFKMTNTKFSHANGSYIDPLTDGAARDLCNHADDPNQTYLSFQIAHLKNLQSENSALDLKETIRQLELKDHWLKESGLGVIRIAGCGEGRLEKTGFTFLCPVCNEPSATPVATNYENSRHVISLDIDFECAHGHRWSKNYSANVCGSLTWDMGSDSSCNDS